jgi:hypothetical protein
VRSAQVLAVRALLLGALLASAGCFRPKNLSGGFSCPNNGPCPDGLVCNASQICVSSLDGGVVGTGGTGGKGGAGGKGGTAGRDAGAVDRPCTGAIASCSPSDAGMCDPVCNTRCGECYQKCSVNSNGALTCNEPYKTSLTAGGLLQLCSQYAVATDPTTQSDNCGPGQVCVTANNCGSRCYQFCRTNSDCTNGASCSRSAGGGYMTCDVPPVDCDPVIGAASKTSSGCPGMTATSLFGCYLSATTPTTLCDCQNSNGLGTEGSACSHSRDCFAGLICIATSTSQPTTCRRVCRLPGDGGVVVSQQDEGGCKSGPTACTLIAFPNGTTNPTYGFCND